MFSFSFFLLPVMVNKVDYIK